MNEDVFSLLANAECAELRAKLQAAEARVKELLEDNARGAAYVAHLKDLIARQQGGDK